MAFQRRSPRARWYSRASFQAASAASDPPDTKKALLRSPGASTGQLGGQLDRARVGERPVDGERQLAHLRRRRLAHLGPVPVADVHAEEPGQGVEVALAVRVLEVAAVAPHDHLELLRVGVAAHLREVEPEVVERGAGGRRTPSRGTISCD